MILIAELEDELEGLLHLFREADGKTVLLELGVGFNTPTIIRFPFEKLAREHENIRLVRLSRSKAMVPASLGDRAVGINADMARSITDLAERIGEEIREVPA